MAYMFMFTKKTTDGGLNGASLTSVFQLSRGTTVSNYPGAVARGFARLLWLWSTIPSTKDWDVVLWLYREEDRERIRVAASRNARGLQRPRPRFAL